MLLCSKNRPYFTDADSPQNCRYQCRLISTSLEISSFAVFHSKINAMNLLCKRGTGRKLNEMFRNFELSTKFTLLKARGFEQLSMLN